MNRNGRGAAFAVQSLNGLSFGVIAVCSDLQVLEMNDAAAEMFADPASGVGMQGGALRFSDARAQAEVAAAVERSARRASASSELLVAARDEKAPLHVTVRPLRPAQLGAAVYLVDPSRELGLSPEQLGRMYGLSRAEARVAAEMLRRCDVAEVANGLSLSVHTVRTHVKSIFAKTGARRQSDLVRLLAGWGSIRFDV